MYTNIFTHPTKLGSIGADFSTLEKKNAAQGFSQIHLYFPQIIRIFTDFLQEKIFIICQKYLFHSCLNKKKKASKKLNAFKNLFNKSSISQ